MALSANTIRDYDLGDINEYGVLSGATIYEGSAVGSSGGYARALTAGDMFLGFACEGKVETASSSGSINIRVWSRGKVELAVTSVAITDVGKAVYATDDGSFVLTNSSSYSRIGTVHRYVSSGYAVVAFDAALLSPFAPHNLGKWNSSTVGAGNIVSATQTAVVRVYADDGGVALTNTGGFIRAGVFRTLIVTAAPTYGGGCFGLQAQLKVSGVAVGTTASDPNCGIWCMLESKASSVMTGTWGGCLATVSLPASAEIAADSYLACFVGYAPTIAGTTTGYVSVMHVKTPTAGTFDAAFSFDHLTATGCITSSALSGGTSQYIKVIIAGKAYTVLATTTA